MLYALIKYLTPQLQIFILKPHDLMRLVVVTDKKGHEGALDGTRVL